MRTIKFRAWDKQEKKWLLGYEYSNLGGFSMFGETMMMGEYANLLSSYFPKDIERIELMQFTGLLDKNGKEIYEGDIVIAHFTTEDGEAYRYVVEIPDIYTRTYLDRLEIIGNIYENSDLIK